MSEEKPAFREISDEEFDKLSRAEKTAYLNEQAKADGRYYGKHIFNNQHEALGIFNAISSAMAKDEED
jgi:hypothetical protein